MNRLCLIDRSKKQRGQSGWNQPECWFVCVKKKSLHPLCSFLFCHCSSLVFLCRMDGQVFVRQLSWDTYLNLSLIEINRMVSSSHFTHLNLPIKQFQWLEPQARNIYQRTNWGTTCLSHIIFRNVYQSRYINKQNLFQKHLSSSPLETCL